jgi:membrane-bound serine protease (ClpP class)
VRSHWRKVVTGREALIGSRAEVLDWKETGGHVWAASERWRACGPEGLTAGQTVRVTGVEGLRLEVAPGPQGEAT